MEWRTLPEPPSSTFIASAGGQNRRIRGGTLEFKIEAMPSGTVTLDLDAPPIDYSAEFAVSTQGRDGSEDRRFTGYVTSANVVESELRLEVKGGLLLAESRMPFTRTSGLDARELLLVLLQETGLPFRIDASLPDMQMDMFLVQSPLKNVELEEGIDVGRSRITPARLVDEETIKALNEAGSRSFSAMASTVVAAETILEAEQRGLEHLVCSVDTLITTNAYSYGTDPRGVWLQYDRVRARTRPKRDDFVLVRGLLTGRSWLRGTGSHFGEPSHPLVGFMERWPIPAAELPPQNIRLAMASLRQAGDESEHPVKRNQALWNALEFYAANTECEAVLCRSERKTLRRLVESGGFDEGKQLLILEVLSGVNTPPLMKRIVTQAERDGAALTDEERALFRRLRSERNGSSHGKHAVATVSELARGVSVTARLLIYSWYASVSRESRDASEAPTRPDQEDASPARPGL